MAVILGLSVNSGFTFIKNRPAVSHVTISFLLMFGVQRHTALLLLFLLSEQRIRIGRRLYTAVSEVEVRPQRQESMHLH